MSHQLSVVPGVIPRKPRPLVRPATVTAAILALVACGDSTTEPLRKCVGQGSGTVSVDTGVTPVIRWSPDCLAAGITVVDRDLVEEPTVRWQINSDNDSIASGVRYGDMPESAFGSDALPLIRGHEHMVVVFLRLEGSESIRSYGLAYFTP